MKSSKPGLSQIAYAAIKKMIITGQLPPGKMLSEAQIQHVLSMGRTPVHEAFLQLSKDQLVRIIPRKGIEISVISLKTVRDIFEMRILLEPAALERFAENLDICWLQQMQEQFKQLPSDETMTKEQILEAVQLDNEFHTVIAQAGNNQYMQEMMNNFLNQLTLIRMAMTTNIKRSNTSNLEHIHILESILGQDIPTATTLLREHLEISYKETMTSYVSDMIERPL